MAFAAVFAHMHGLVSHEAHARLAQALDRHVGNLRITVCCSELPTATQSLLGRNRGWELENYDGSSVWSAMSRALSRHIPEQWILWLDQDATPADEEWFPRTRAVLEGRPSVSYAGQPWIVRYRKQEVDWIRGRDWYSGVPLKLADAKGRSICGLEHAHPAYWWMKTEELRDIGWPDPGLEDAPAGVRPEYMLGEAARQSKASFCRLAGGMVIREPGGVQPISMGPMW